MTPHPVPPVLPSLDTTVGDIEGLAHPLFLPSDPEIKARMGVGACEAVEPDEQDFGTRPTETQA